MNILARFRVFALVFSSAFIALLLVGCGGHSLAIYEPIGESPSNLRETKVQCEARTAIQMAPIVAQQQALAAQRSAEASRLEAAEAQARAAREQASALHSLGGNRWTRAQVDTESLISGSAIANVANIAADYHAQAAIQEQRMQLYAACLTEYGWRYAGDMEFRDANAPIPKTDTGYAPLHVVALNSNTESVSWLISQGADVGVKDDAGETPLHWAAFGDAEQSAMVLLNNGANIDAQTNNGVTPLHAAAKFDSEKVAALLVKNGANVNAITVDDWSPLHTAARHNSRKVIGLLLAEGANIDARGGDEGITPLHSAALHGHTEAADLLIARGANLDAKTYADETPLDIAKREGKRDVVVLLERAARVAARKANNESGETNSADGENSAESVFENAWRSVVVVVAGGKQGGGAVINEPNRVATNCHVVDESPNDIRVYKGENRRAVRDAPHSAEIVSSDRERDVCILSVSGLWGIPAKIRSAAELEIGEAVYAVGTPKGLDFSISNGIVSQLREEVGETAPLIQTDAAISPGSSGGGLFDSEGRLVGLTTWKIREGENLNFAIPIEWALELE